MGTQCVKICWKKTGLFKQISLLKMFKKVTLNNNKNTKYTFVD